MMVALFTMEILILIQTIPLIHYIHYLLVLIRVSNVYVWLCGGWLLLVLFVLVTLRCRLNMLVCGMRAPEPSTAGAIGVVSKVIHIVIPRIFVAILAWLRRAGNPTGLIQVPMDMTRFPC